MAASKDEFRQALGSLADSVTVVTTKAASGQPLGITVTSFTSLSLEPPLVLVCIDKRARIHGELSVGRAMAVNILAEDQQELSRRFASSKGEPFADLAVSTGLDGVPLLPGVVTTIECRIVDCLPGGDHTIVVGEVEATAVNTTRPLLYFRGGYGRLA